MLKIDNEDYTVIFDTREQYLFIPAVVVERKASCDELIGNMLDHRKDTNGNNRFIRELERSKQQNLKVYLLIQDKDYYLKLITGEYRSKVNPKAISGMIISLLAKYPNLHIIAVDKELSPSIVYKILYYELRENLKEKIK